MRNNCNIQNFISFYAFIYQIACTVFYMFIYISVEKPIYSVIIYLSLISAADIPRFVHSSTQNPIALGTKTTDPYWPLLKINQSFKFFST